MALTKTERNMLDFIGGMMIITLVVVVAIVIIGKSQAKKDAVKKEKESLPVKTTKTRNMYRKEFDGHVWAVYLCASGAGLEHHPDCPCRKTNQ